MKLFTVLVLVLSASGCATLQQIDQGLYGVANGVGARDRVTGARTLSLSGRQQMIASQNAQMDEYFKEIQSKGGKLNADLDAAGYARVQRITSRLLQVSHFSDEQTQWKVFLLPDDSFNAFVNGGSYIMVHKGLLDQVQSDDEVAAVLGHEIGHNAANHIGERGTYQKVALITGSDSSQRDTFQKSFSMEQEREADRIGILYAALAGYDPYAASRIWERMYDLEGNQALISAHPLNRDRVEETKKTAAEVNAYYTSGQINPNASALLTNNTLWHQQADTFQAGSGGGLAAVTETVFTAYMQREQAKLVEKKQQLHAAQVLQVNQLLQLLKVAAINDTSVGAQFLYRGNIALKVLTMRAILPDGTVIVAHAQPPVLPGQQFVLIFDGKTLPIGSQARLLKFGVDDAAF